MHIRELVELAALVSSQAGCLTRGTDRISRGALEQYWSASKCRLDRWARTLKTFSASGAAQNDSADANRSAWVAIEEILAGEVLTRVWTAVAVACDRRLLVTDAGPIARSVLSGHLEARNRALALVVQPGRAASKAAASIDRLRRRTERWTDLLIGRLPASDLDEFAVHAERARDFAQDLQHQRSQGLDASAWSVLLASLRASFQSGLSGPSPNADLNARIATSILSCFTAEIVDSAGEFPWLCRLRLANAATDVEQMIDQLLVLESSSGRPADSRP
jgi:hypothetical protein